MSEIKSVIDMNCEEARKFFLKNESYFSQTIPVYFDFSKLLNEISDLIGNIDKFSDIVADDKNPNELENVNYHLFVNKDGKYGRRKLQFIHPVLYVYLVHFITKKSNWEKILARIEKLSNDELIYCASWPRDKGDKKTDTAQNINSWLHNYEEYSIELSLDYKYLLKTDITGCYGSIYTHSIPRALHDKKVIKSNMGNLSRYYGNEIDRVIRAMSNGQTNGIPEGSALMDFIAELVLLYIDSELIKGIKDFSKNSKKWNPDYKIIRFRDDYHIFVNDPEFGKEIIKKLSSILASMGMKLNSEKTIFSENIISNAVKKDKMVRFREFKRSEYKKKDDDGLENNENNEREQHIRGLKKWLLLINDFSDNYPNSGSILVLLDDFSKALENKKIITFTDIKVLIAILINIGYSSPRAYPSIFNILSELIDYLGNDEEKNDILNRVYEKLSRLPKSEYLDIWIQRLGFKTENFDDSEKICAQFNINKLGEIWNNDWLKDKYKNILDSGTIIDEEKKAEVTHIIPRGEVCPYDDYGY